MEKRINRLRNKSFEKMILDQPVPNVKVKFSLRGNKPKLETIRLLPEPLKPTKPKPVPKPRVKSKRPVPLPRQGSLPRRRPVPRRRPKIYIAPKPKPIDMKVKKSLRANIVKRRQALRNRVKSFEVDIIERTDPAKQLYYTTSGVAEELEDILNTDGAMKAQVTLHVLFKKKRLSTEMMVKQKKFLNIKMHILIVRLLLS